MTGSAPTESPREIGGWLLLLGLTMLGTLLVYLRATAIAPDLFGVIINLFWIALILFLIFIYLIHHEAFPRTFTGFYWSVSLLLWSDVLNGTASADLPLIVTLVTLGWTIYLHGSVRVKHTFVHKDFSRLWRNVEIPS